MKFRLLQLGRFVCEHWLAAANVLLFLFAALPALAPVLESIGASSISLQIFQVYSFTCHQMPSRSYFILGNQMAYCERNTAIYGAMAATGVAFAWFRRHSLPTLTIPMYAILILPMAVDGFTQLAGLRESTWYLRGLTGALFGLATIWLTFPRLEENFNEVKSDLARFVSNERVT